MRVRHGKHAARRGLGFLPKKVVALAVVVTMALFLIPMASVFAGESKAPDPGKTAVAKHDSTGAGVFKVAAKGHAVKAPVAPAHKAPKAKDATVQINFPGIDGVTVQYGFGPYVTPTTDASDTYKLVIPKADIPADNQMALRLMKGGMYYATTVELKAGCTVTVDVPVSSIQIIGIASTCNLGIGQNDWVYRMAPATVGALNEFKVFDNGEPYYVRLLKDGFHEIVVANVMPGSGYVYFGPSYFYQVTIPTGVSNVWIASNSWAVKGANAGDKITLLCDAPGPFQTANMTFEFGGITYSTSFLLDGTDPFAGNYTIVNFAGVEGVTLQYYAGGVWNSCPGTFDSSTGLIKLPAGVTSLRAAKGGMTYQFDGVALTSAVNAFDVPTIELWAMGVWAEGCTLGVVQSNWVYQNVAPVVSGTTKFFVFDNGKDYTVRLNKPGFYTIDRVAVAGDGILYVYLADTVFYQIEVPDGVSNLRMQSNNWIYPMPANAGDKIDLLKDDNNIRDAKMTFDFDGVNYTVNFKLDGSNPFAGLSMVNFAGVDGVSVQYYLGGVWQTCPGTFDGSTGLINLPAGATSLRAVKGGMNYQFNDVSFGYAVNIFDVPTIELNLIGIWAEGCTVGVIQNSWVYQNVSPVVSGQTDFMVFDNGRDYSIRVSKAGFYSIDRVAVEGSGNLYVYLANNVFYQIEVPDGVSNVRMQSNGWIYPMPAKAGDKIDLLTDSTNLRNAKMTYDFEGSSYSFDFVLDGSDPFAALGF